MGLTRNHSHTISVPDLSLHTSGDQFLTSTAVAGNFVNALGRLMWGALSDRFRSKYLIIGAAILGMGVESVYWSFFRYFKNYFGFLPLYY